MIPVLIDSPRAAAGGVGPHDNTLNDRLAASDRTDALKTQIVNRTDETRAPFLRGILIRSLLDAGLDFARSQKIAGKVRERISDRECIDSEDLRRIVEVELKRSAAADVLRQYQNPNAAPDPIVVIDESGESTAFSRARHERYLRASGLDGERAERVTADIYEHLLANGVERINGSELAVMTYCCLAQEHSRGTARRYLTWLEFQSSGRPLLLAVCGTVGAGKSTIATELAHQFGIVRTQSTDILREVMRTLVPDRLLPLLHSSSYEAWKALPGARDSKEDREILLAKAFRMQADMLMLPCEAVLRRAIQERVSIILEGVHVLPSLMRQVPADSDAITVHVTLAILKSKQLKSRLKGRGKRAPGRKARHYLDNLGSIWGLQSLLLSEADQNDASIIPNTDRDLTVRQVTRTVNAELARCFDGDPERVLGKDFIRCAGSGDWRECFDYLVAVPVDQLHEGDIYGFITEVVSDGGGILQWHTSYTTNVDVDAVVVTDAWCCESAVSWGRASATDIT